jgi:aspartokinase/homoserine dehydrogenase 1
VAIVAAVGDKMRGTPGVAATVFGALGGAGINVIAISQGSSERNISLVVTERDAATAVRAIHGAFQLEKTS